MKVSFRDHQKAGSAISILLLGYPCLYHPCQVLIPHRQSRIIPSRPVQPLVRKSRKLQPSWLRERLDQVPGFVWQELLYGL